MGGELNVLAFEREIVEGFTDIYRLMMREREALLAEDGRLARFAHDEVRSVLRATRSYGLLLTESHHPDHQRDALELDRFFDRLWVGVEDNPHLLAVIAAERRDLENGDIPLFTTRPASHDVWTSRGERIESYWDKTGLELVMERVQTLAEPDLRRQVWFIRASLATLSLNQDELAWPSYSPAAHASNPDPVSLRDECLANARTIGDRLDELALRDGDDVAWIGLAFANEQWGLVPLLDDIYGGVAGVIHFLAYLGHVAREERYSNLARDAARTFRRRLKDTRKTMRAIGAFNGWGGVIYALSHWSVLWNERDLVLEGQSIVELLPELIDADGDLDVIGGSAGCLMSLLCLQRVAPSARNVELARRCGDRIVERATRMEAGLGWFTRIETELPITGFSHGAAGIAWALAELFGATGDERYRQTAIEAIRYEHSRFLPEQENWLDTSNSESKPKEQGELTLSMAWCYGAPGIGLARLRSLAHLEHPLVREELNIALKSTLAKGFGRNHSLCHGDLGNLDFVLQTSELLDDDRLRALVREITSSVLASMRRDGFLCGVPLGVESPALMNGLAGIGFGLLRQAEPERVPSVLAPPPAS